MPTIPSLTGFGGCHARLFFFYIFADMKRLAIVIGIISGLVLMAACARPSQVPELEVAEQSRSIEGPSKKLVAVDSLMWRQPDSALALLLPWFDSCGDVSGNVSTTFDLHYAHLLLSELLYKNYYEQTNRADLLQSEAYFDSISLIINNHPRIPWSHCEPSFRECGTLSPQTKDNIAFLAARTHYMDGVGLYENDSAVEACREYMKALQCMNTHYKEKNLVGYKAKFMALTHTRLTDLYSDLYLHEQAVYFARLSLPYYQKQNYDSRQICRMLYEIGLHFEMMEQFDSAYCYYQKATTKIIDTNDLMYRDLLALKTGLVYKMDGLSNTSIPQLQRLISLAQDHKEKSARYLALGEILYYEKQFDSASAYLKKVFDESHKTASKKQAAEWLIEICKAQGREAEMAEYAHFLVPFANHEENNSATKSQFTELYNTFRQNVSDQQHQRNVRKNAQWSAMALGILLIIIFTIICFYNKNKQKLKRLESQKPKEPTEAQGRLLAFMEESLCQEIIQSVQGKHIKRLATPKAFPELVLTDAQLQQLDKLATRYFGSMGNLLEKHGLKAKPVLVNLCHLYLLGMDEKQAAILINRDYSSVKRYEKTLKTAFHTQQNMVAFMKNTVLSQ